MIDIKFIPKKIKHVIAQDVEDETLLLNEDGSEIHQLNLIASQMWHYCNGYNSVGDITTDLLKLYDVSHEKLLNDVIETITQLQNKGLIE